MQFNPSNPELMLADGGNPDRTLGFRIVGVGGAGVNAVSRLRLEGLERLQPVVIDADAQALAASPVPSKVAIGTGVTRGLGAGGDPEIGRAAAAANRAPIGEALKGSDLVFVAAGLGGGTGVGAAPVVADVATEQGALVVAFAFLPFSFEGGRRLRQAEEGLAALRRVCDAVIPISNDILLQECGEGTAVDEAFARADRWIERGVRSIWTVLFRPGLIHLDLASLRQMFQSRGGKTLFSLGRGEGPQAVAQVIEDLRISPLLHTPEFARKADRLLVNIIGGPDLTLPKVNELMTAITEQYGRDANVIMGAVVDETMAQHLEVCVLGTTDMAGRGGGGARRAAAPRSAPAAAAPKQGSTPPALAPEPEPPAGPKPEQNEFTFNEVESRGHFDKTDRNLFEGQDLDVPTYLRKGIKIVA